MAYHMYRSSARCTPSIRFAHRKPQRHQAMGHSDIFLKLSEIIPEIVIRSYLRRDEHQRLCRSGEASLSPGSFPLVINAWPNRKLLGYKLTKQLRDILPALRSPA